MCKMPSPPPCLLGDLEPVNPATSFPPCFHCSKEWGEMSVASPQDHAVPPSPAPWDCFNVIKFNFLRSFLMYFLYLFLETSLLIFFFFCCQIDICQVFHPPQGLEMCFLNMKGILLTVLSHAFLFDFTLWKNLQSGEACSKIARFGNYFAENSFPVFGSV